MTTVALPFVDLTVRDVHGRWNVDFLTDCGDMDSLALEIGRGGADDRLEALTLEATGTKLCLARVSVDDVRDLAAVLLRVAEKMDSTLARLA